jgi:hypothetical protein
MGVHPQRHLRGHQLLEADGSPIDGRGVGGAARILQADAVDLDVAFQEPPSDVDVELGGVDRIRMEG